MPFFSIIFCIRDVNVQTPSNFYRHFPNLYFIVHNKYTVLTFISLNEIETKGLMKMKKV